MHSIIFIAFVIGHAPFASSSRILYSDLIETAEVYPEAEDFSPTWNTIEGIQADEENWNKLTAMKEGGDSRKDVGPAEMKEALTLLTHMLFVAFQGQPCMDMCTVCMPKMEDFRSGDPALRTIALQRSKSLGDTVKFAFTGLVNATLGAAVGAVLGALPAIGLGIGLGANQGKAVAEQAQILTGTNNTAPGTILGLISGLSSGIVLGALDMVLIESAALLFGAYKGAGLTPMLTKCGRLGFEVNENGSPAKQQNFNNVFGNKNYGLKKLRKWMKANEYWKSNSVLEEILPYDNESISHCEKLRYHNFDMRHANQCVQHSQLCGDQGGFVLPIPSGSMCSKLSDFKWLEDMAVKYGDDPEEGFFASWRKLQEQMKQEFGHDGEKDQCIRLLCEHKGYKKASLKYHPDKIQAMRIDEEKKQELRNTMTFLNQCKDLHKLRLDDEAERVELCGSSK